MGSSPLTRGKRLATVRKGLWAGLIPAHAGKTATSCGHCLPTTAHPRSRGENHRMNTRRRRKLGSSPLTRGKLREAVLGHVAELAHPRSRGENQTVKDVNKRYSGSSPLTRGKLDESLDEILTSGLIPAHAGKTSSAHSSQASKPAHPRSRGENQIYDLGYYRERGSSPLTRGKHLSKGAFTRRTGLIPAHAGKTSPR